MMDSDRTATVAFDWSLALLLAAAIGWSALRVGVPWQAGVAALTGFGLGLGALRWAGQRPGRYRLPAFALPDWPAVEAVPVSDVLPEGVVRLPVRRLTTPGELEARIKAHLAKGPAPTAEVVALKPDATAALRQALAGLKGARG